MAANHDLCFTTGSEAIEAFKKKKLSPVELMNAVISRCEEVNPRLNAVTYSFFERALEQAKKAEARYVKSPTSASRTATRAGGFSASQGSVAETLATRSSISAALKMTDGSRFHPRRTARHEAISGVHKRRKAFWERELLSQTRVR